MQYIRPSYLLPACELLWGVVTFAQSAAGTTHELYALRFLLGLFEAPFVRLILSCMLNSKIELAVVSGNAVGALESITTGQSQY
jgi:hypothetical protein